MAKDTSWQNSSRWYQKHIEKEGSYNHRELILPKLLPLLNLSTSSSLLDLGCGQGVLSFAIDPKIRYLGLDASQSLIKYALDKKKSKNHEFKRKDVTQALNLDKKFSHAAFVLSIQNMAYPQKALIEASKALEKNGKLALVINHPCYRIPKHSSWEFIENHKGQYRRIDRYMSPFKATLQTHPSQGKSSPKTFSFHHPLSNYFTFLKEAGFLVEDLVEVCSNKKSYGKAAKSENFARKEFPLFMIILASKHSH